MSGTTAKDIVYDLRLPRGLVDSSLPVVEGVREAGRQGKVDAVRSGLAAAINIAVQLGIDVDGKGLGAYEPEIKI